MAKEKKSEKEPQTAEERLQGQDSEQQQKQPELSPEARKELEKMRAKLQVFQKQLLKKFPYIIAMGVLPPQASKMIEEEEEIPKHKDDKLMHSIIIIPDEKEKDEGKIKAEAIKLTQSIKPRLWVHTKTANDIWEICSDGKYEMLDAIAMSLPLYDKGTLGALRVSSIHRTLCMRKFDKYIVSYVIAGSIVRGTATKTSDVDVFVVVDDTDVKRMSRYELRDKLRSIIYKYAFEAQDIAQSKNKISPQIYILTEFWEGVRDANPIFFTFIRDGVPLYDRGTFTPWKLLLKMGKITGTPESIDKFLTIGEKMGEDIKKKFLDLAEDIYWSVLTPSQGVLMLYGLAPPTPRETVELMKKVFVDKENLLEAKYLHILEKVVEMYKDYEHDKLKELDGEQVDKIIKDTEDYRKRLRKLVEQIEKKVGEKTVLKIYEDAVSLISAITGKKSESEIMSAFESEFVKKGKMPSSSLHILEEIIKAKKDYAKGKLSRSEIDRVRRDSQIIIASLTEYMQRKELTEAEKKAEKK